MFRIGQGKDIHKLAEGLPLIIGGVRIPFEKGAAGHSDGDVLLHAATDSILGALAMGDIGSHFSDTDNRWKGANSEIFLQHAIGLAKSEGYELLNLDSTISLEKPKLRPYIEEMRSNISRILMIGIDQVSIKAKTSEGLGPIGLGEAISAEAIVVLARK